MILHYKRAIQDILDHKFLNAVTIITIAISILIVSAFALFFVNASDIISSWQKDIRIMAYLRPDIPHADIGALKFKIQDFDAVKNVKFISKEEGLQMLKDQMKRQPSLFVDLKENPLPDAFEIRMIPTSQIQEKIEGLTTSLEALPEINDVEYAHKWLARFTNIFNLFKLTGFALGSLFSVAAVFIVANTIRLVLYTRREEVEIMRLVGAADSFIKAPFYIEGIIQGALGGTIGLAALFVTFLIVSSNVQQSFAPDLFTVRFLSIKVYGALIFCSTCVGWLGCYLSLKHFLKP